MDRWAVPTLLDFPNVADGVRSIGNRRGTRAERTVP
jgi:hypothetical protein